MPIFIAMKMTLLELLLHIFWWFFYVFMFIVLGISTGILAFELLFLPTDLVAKHVYQFLHTVAKHVYQVLAITIEHALAILPAYCPLLLALVCMALFLLRRHWVAECGLLEGRLAAAMARQSKTDETVRQLEDSATVMRNDGAREKDEHCKTRATLVSLNGELRSTRDALASLQREHAALKREWDFDKSCLTADDLTRIAQAREERDMEEQRLRLVAEAAKREADRRKAQYEKERADIRRAEQRQIDRENEKWRFSEAGRRAWWQEHGDQWDNARRGYDD